MSHKNYKQKYLDALERHRTEPFAPVDKAQLKTQSASATNTDANLALRQIASVVGEVSIAAQNLIKEMDAHTKIAGMEFAEIEQEIDLKLTKMPIHVAMRRIRDVFKIAEARIAMLHIQADDLHIVNQTLHSEVDKVDASRKNVERSLYDNVWIGAGASPDEIDDFESIPQGEYRRFGLNYEDADDEFIMTRLFANTSLREVRSGSTSDPDDSTDESDDDVPTKKRLAQIVPTSPVQQKKVDI